MDIIIYMPHGLSLYDIPRKRACSVQGSAQPTGQRNRMRLFVTGMGGE